jgi:multiple sugar transport system substrate-binding protein
MARRLPHLLFAFCVLAVCLLAFAPAGTPQSGNPRVLRVWLMDASTPSIARAYRDLAADFEHQHPGTRVELSQIPYQQYRDKLVLAVQGGTGPDVMMLDQIWTPEFAAAHLIRDLAPQLRTDPTTRAAAYFPGAWSSNLWNGGLWGLPFNTDVWERLYYNADLFRKAGLDPDRPPRTWPQWLAAARRINAVPGAHGIGLIGCRDESASVLTDSLLFSAGGSVASGAHATLDSPAGRRAFTLYQSLARYAPNGVAGACAPDVEAQFTAGATGMILDGAWSEPTFATAAKFDWRATTPPAPPGRSFTGALGGWNLAVGAHAPRPGLAYDFLRLACATPRYQLALNDSVPALRSAGQKFVHDTRKDPAGMLRLLEQGEPRPVTPVYSRISTAQQIAIQEILGGADVGTALASAQRTMQHAIRTP